MMTRATRLVLLVGLAMALPASRSPAQPPLPDAKPVPRFQVLPLPEDQASFQDNGRELARYYFGSELHRPFLYPINGPSGRSLTRMGHPHDPVGHSHHNSVWISHNNVNGQNFWADDSGARIVTRKIIQYEDGPESASLVAVNDWVGGQEDRVELRERRRLTVRSLADPELRETWLLLIDLELEAGREPTIFGQSPFGLVGVRMAKTIGVNDGGGLIRNSEGNVNEEGPNGCFWKSARWIDYSGPITLESVEGLTLFDHPDNPNHPTHFHVRADGWMGASLSFDGPLTIEPEEPLRLRYGLLVHPGAPDLDWIEGHWREFADLPFDPIPEK